MFARRFIADDKEKARQFNIEAREDFRSIVYGYTSRVRRGDAGLAFPDRKVQMHQVKPTDAEVELIRAIAKPIQKMNRLAQIGILKDLTSSPEALRARLNNMARNGTAPQPRYLAPTSFSSPSAARAVPGLTVPGSWTSFGARLRRAFPASP